ncbi:MAG: 6-pyruvoyl trahydropterin synthase family protein [Dehalococcoidia bacterium]
MAVTRKVSVERNRLRFAAAHMATFHGECEPLHGHNYDVSLEVEGALTEDAWVWDFGDLKRTMRGLCEQLDHKFLLQRQSTMLAIEEQAAHWSVAFGDKSYLFPKADVAVLPIPNTTAEQIAEWMGGFVIAELKRLGATNIVRVTIGVEEMPGQAGWYTVDV